MIILIAALLLTGCATSSVFMPYPDQLMDIKNRLATGQFEAAQKSLSSQRHSADKLLYLMERGRVSQLAGDRAASIDDFEQAIQLFEANERKAKITASGVVGQVGALVANDNAIPYVGSAYERIFVHNYQALNYLDQGDLEAAGVEVRRANLEQQLALRRYEDELERVKNGRDARRILSGNAGYQQKTAALSRLSGRVKNSFQNAYTFYISGLIYEARGEFNDAYIDYKKALEIFPDNAYLRADVVRLAQQLSMKEDLALYRERAGENLAKGMLPGQGRLVVLYERDYVPEKVEIFFPLWVIGVMHSIAFPTYTVQPPFRKPLTLTVDRKKQGSTAPIVNVSALAAKALEERMPMIMVRQATRIIAREGTRKAINNDAVGLISSVANLLLNRADLRSWLTLPVEAQIMYTNLPEGQHVVDLEAGGLLQSKRLDVMAGQTTILHVVAAGGRLYVNTIEL